LTPKRPFPMRETEVASSGPVVAGTVFDIQRYAVHDGPGIRTLVFLKGCPLACIWCQNPEGRRKEPSLLWYAPRCSGCGVCAGICPNGAVSLLPSGAAVTDRKMCRGCGLCVEKCPGEARTIAGRSMQAGEVFEEVMKDCAFYRRGGGGVTLSGGEPLMQPEFSAAVLALCKEQFIHTAVETCGHADDGALETVLRFADLVLLDLKQMDPGTHERVTGVDNLAILRNARHISEMGKDLIVRIPVIPGVNDSMDNIRAAMDFVAGLPTVRRVDVLPYHRFGEGKYEALGITYPLEGALPPDAEFLSDVMKVVSSYGVEALLEGFRG
jgi:pyruvate formate lyase activating enzyme